MPSPCSISSDLFETSFTFLTSDFTHFWLAEEQVIAQEQINSGIRGARDLIYRVFRNSIYLQKQLVSLSQNAHLENGQDNHY